MQKDTLTVQVKVLPENDEEALKIYNHYQINNKVRAFYEFTFRSLLKGIIFTVENGIFIKKRLSEESTLKLKEYLLVNLKRDPAKMYFPCLIDLNIKNSWRKGGGQTHNNLKIYFINSLYDKYKEEFYPQQKEIPIDEVIKTLINKLEEKELSIDAAFHCQKIKDTATKKENKHKKFNEELEIIKKIFNEDIITEQKKYIQRCFDIYADKILNPMIIIDEEVKSLELNSYILPLSELSKLNSEHEFYIAPEFLQIYDNANNWNDYPSLLKAYSKSSFATQTIGKISSHNSWKQTRKEKREEVQAEKEKFENKWKDTNWFKLLEQYEEKRTQQEKEANSKSRDFFITTRVIKGLGSPSTPKLIFSLWNKESTNKPVDEKRAIEIVDKYQSANNKDIGDRPFINWLAAKPELWWNQNPEASNLIQETQQYPVELWVKKYTKVRLDFLKASRAMRFQYINPEHPQWPVWNMDGDDAHWKWAQTKGKNYIILESPFVGDILLKVQYDPECDIKRFLENNNKRPERFLIDFDSNNKVPVFKLKDAKTRRHDYFEFKPSRLTIINEVAKENFSNQEALKNDWYAYIVLNQNESAPARLNFGFLANKYRVKNDKLVYYSLDDNEFRNFISLSPSDKLNQYVLPDDIEMAIEDGARIMSVDLGMRDDAIVSIWGITEKSNNKHYESKLSYDIPGVDNFQAVHITSSVLNIPYKYSPLNKEIREKWIIFQQELKEFLLQNEEKAKYIADWWNDPAVKSPRRWIDLFASSIEASLKILNERKALRYKKNLEGVKTRYDETTRLLKECTDFINLCLYKKGKFAHLGGLNLKRIEALERLNILKRRLNTEPDLENPDKIIHLTENFAKDFKKHLKNLRDERAKQLAALIVKEALGVNPESKHLPVQVIIFENLKTYSQRDFRDRGENKKLSLWSHRNVVNYTTAFARDYGILVQDIYAIFSSQTCSFCGAPGKRVHQTRNGYRVIRGGKLFQCSNSNCERYQRNPVNADINAAQVLAKRFLSQLVFEPVTLKPEIPEEATSFDIELERRKKKHKYSLRPKAIGYYTVYVNDAISDKELEREGKLILEILKESEKEEFDLLTSELETEEAEATKTKSKSKKKTRKTRKTLMHDTTGNILSGYWLEAADFHKIVQMLVNKRLKELNTEKVPI